MISLIDILLLLVKLVIHLFLLHVNLVIKGKHIWRSVHKHSFLLRKINSTYFLPYS